MWGRLNAGAVAESSDVTFICLQHYLVKYRTRSLDQLYIVSPKVDDFENSRLLWPPYVIGQAIIFLSCGFFFFLSFYLSFFLA